MFESKTINSNLTKDRARQSNRAAETSQSSCPVCGENAMMLTTFAAADLLGVTVYSIYRRAETGNLHFTVHNDGSLLVCRKSLLAQYGQ